MSCTTKECRLYCNHYLHRGPGHGPGIALEGQKKKVMAILKQVNLDACPTLWPYDSGSWIKVAFIRDSSLKGRLDQAKADLGYPDVICNYFEN